MRKMECYRNVSVYSELEWRTNCMVQLINNYKYYTGKHKLGKNLGHKEGERNSPMG